MGVSLWRSRDLGELAGWNSTTAKAENYSLTTTSVLTEVVGSAVSAAEGCVSYMTALLFAGSVILTRILPFAPVPSIPVKRKLYFLNFPEEPS